MTDRKIATSDDTRQKVVEMARTALERETEFTVVERSELANLQMLGRKVEAFFERGLTHLYLGDRFTLRRNRNDDFWLFDDKDGSVGPIPVGSVMENLRKAFELFEVEHE